MMALITRLLNGLALLAIALYRAVGSLWLGGSCRFEPSCSAYGYEAVQRYGFWVGGKLALARIWRCRPGGSCGYDPVPLLEQHVPKRAANDSVAREQKAEST